MKKDIKKIKKYRVDLKRLCTNILIIATLFMLFNAICNYTFGFKNIETKTIIVEKNDTLWSIAEDICKTSSGNLNIQNIIIEIKNINNLNSSEIFVGQELNVPIYM